LTVNSDVTLTFNTSQNGANYGGDAGRCEMVIQNGGTLSLGSNATLTSAGTWGGVYQYPGGNISLGNGSTISNARFGIFYHGNGTFSCSGPAYITDCTVDGIRITDCSITIGGTWLTDCYNGISCVGVNSVPILYGVCINGSSSQFGLVSCAYAVPDLMSSVLGPDISSHKIYVYQYGSLDIDYKSNDIYDTSPSYGVYIGSNCPTIYARQNYWGTNQPYVAANLFYDPSKITDWSNYSEDPYHPGWLSKAVAQVLAETDDLFRRGHDNELAGAFGDAIENYNEILTKSRDERTRVKALRYMYAATEKNGSEYDGVREKIIREIRDVGPLNKVILRYLLNDILVKEGKYEEAVGKFLKLGQKYKGSSMEIDALVMVAMIQGLYLGDKVQAEKYADMARALNPGHPTLLDAYASAGIAYEPWENENKYAELKEDFGIYDAPQPEEKASITNEDFVTLETNLFNPSTSIIYSIKEPSQVKLDVFSINGQKVATLVDGYMSAGVHTAKFDGSRFASGVYFYRFESGSFNTKGKMLLVK